MQVYRLAESASKLEAPQDVVDPRRPQQPEPVQAVVHVNDQATQTSCERHGALAHARRHRMPVDADENGKVDNPQTRKTQPSVAKAPHAYLRTEKANVEQQLETKLRPKLGNKLLKFKGTGFTLDSDTESLKHDNDEHNLAQPRLACTQSGADV